MQTTHYQLGLLGKMVLAAISMLPSGGSANAQVTSGQKDSIPQSSRLLADNDFPSRLGLKVIFQFTDENGNTVSPKGTQEPIANENGETVVRTGIQESNSTNSSPTGNTELGYLVQDLNARVNSARRSSMRDYRPRQVPVLTPLPDKDLTNLIDEIHKMSIEEIQEKLESIVNEKEPKKSDLDFLSGFDKVFLYGNGANGISFRDFNRELTGQSSQRNFELKYFFQLTLSSYSLLKAPASNITPSDIYIVRQVLEGPFAGCLSNYMRTALGDWLKKQESLTPTKENILAAVKTATNYAVAKDEKFELIWESSGNIPGSKLKVFASHSGPVIWLGVEHDSYGAKAMARTLSEIMPDNVARLYMEDIINHPVHTSYSPNENEDHEASILNLMARNSNIPIVEIPTILSPKVIHSLLQEHPDKKGEIFFAMMNTMLLSRIPVDLLMVEHNSTEFLYWAYTDCVTLCATELGLKEVDVMNDIRDFLNKNMPQDQLEANVANWHREFLVASNEQMVSDVFSSDPSNTGASIVLTGELHMPGVEIPTDCFLGYKPLIQKLSELARVGDMGKK